MWSDQERLRALVPDGKLRVFRSRTGGNEWEALQGLAERDCYVNVLRDAMAITRRPVRCVLRHHGGTGVPVADSGDNWTPIVRDLPAVLSVESRPSK